jgi:RNA polymerase sigma-70 factor (ECF subfamily)
MAAIRLGDVDGLVGLLAADAVHYADGGGKAQATLLPIYGGDKVARLWANIGRRPLEYELRAVDVNGQPGVAAVAPDGTLLTVLTVDVVDDRVQTVWAVVNPDKLARAATALAGS